MARTWKIQDIKLSKEVPQEAKAFFDKMLEDMKANLRLTYKADGNYEAAFNGRVTKGKWELDKDEKVMTATDENGKKVVYTISELTKDKFVYVTSEGQESATFILVPGEPLAASAQQPQQPATEMPTEPTNSESSLDKETKPMGEEEKK